MTNKSEDLDFCMARTMPDVFCSNILIMGKKNDKIMNAK